MKKTLWIAAGVLIALGFLIGAVPWPWQPDADAASLHTKPAGPAYQTWPDPGIYVFFDWSNMNPAQYPYITGGHEVVTWSGVEGETQGQYDWSWLDNWIASNAALGKPVGIGFNSYDGQCCSQPAGHWLPEWYLRDHPDGYITCDGGVILPKYWSDAYLNAFGDFIRAAAARYDDDPRVAWVEISHGIYGETTPAENGYDACLAQAGLTSELWMQTVDAITDIYHAAWQQKPLLIQYAPFYLDRRERREFTDYAGALGIGMKHNKLLVDHNDQVIDDPDYYYYRAGQYDPMLTFAGQVPTGWEAYRLYFETPSDTLWGFLNGMNKHPTYILVTRSLLITSDPLEREVLAFANRYAGRTLQDTPGVWVALRESNQSWYPQRGNFDFWLYQNDEAPGGRTVPMRNVTDQPQGRYTRRTDGATGNPYMYFDVDNGYIFAATRPVSITITYLDQGNDGWELHYDGYQSNEQVAGRVQKTNSGNWLKATFVLTDAEFADGMPGGGDHAGSDFRIWNGGDGDEFIHFVAVVRASSETGSATPTPTPNATPTPTATPTPPPAPGPDLAATYAEQPITVDADLGDWPAGAGWRLDRYTASTIHPRNVPEPDDASLWLQVAWNEDTLYVAAIITDSEQIADSVDVWRDDGIELGIDAAHDHAPGGSDDHQLTATVDGRLTDLGFLEVPGALLATQSYTTHYVIELAVPAPALGLAGLQSDQVLGLTAGLHDDDDGGDWDSYLILAGTATQGSGADWGNLTLLPPMHVSVGGQTWYDINGNGLREPAENDPLSAVEIAILDGQNAVISTTQSTDDGRWLVEGLEPGDYTIVAEQPPGLFPTTPLEVAVTLPGSGGINFGYLGSTGVTLQRFDADAGPLAVTLRWETAHEVDNDGFVPFRQGYGDSGSKPLTLSPIPSQAAPGAGAVYTFVDENVAPGHRYTYWIESVPGGERFGPLTVTLPQASGSYRVFLPWLDAS